MGSDAGDYNSRSGVLKDRTNGNLFAEAYVVRSNRRRAHRRTSNSRGPRGALLQQRFLPSSTSSPACSSLQAGEVATSAASFGPTRGGGATGGRSRTTRRLVRPRTRTARKRLYVPEFAPQPRRRFATAGQEVSRKLLAIVSKVNFPSRRVTPRARKASPATMVRLHDKRLGPSTVEPATSVQSIVSGVRRSQHAPAGRST